MSNDTYKVDGDLDFDINFDDDDLDEVEVAKIPDNLTQSRKLEAREKARNKRRITVSIPKKLAATLYNHVYSKRAKMETDASLSQVVEEGISLYFAKEKRAQKYKEKKSST